MIHYTICIPSDDGQPFKRGRILRHLADTLVALGHRVMWDDGIAPDCYIVEAVMPEIRHPSVPIIIHAENLIGDYAVDRHAYRDAAAIVFNSNWLRTLYRNTFQHELPTVRVIPPAFDDRRLTEDGTIYTSWETPIVCCSKWGKRPYKRLPLHAAAVQRLREGWGWKQARLHVFGWEPTMPYVHTAPYLWGSLPMSGVRVHQRSYDRMTYPALLSGARLVLHASAIDSGPQTVMEAIARGIPAVATNNMGAAEWIREIGPEAGEVVEIDEVTDTFPRVQGITNPRWCRTGWRATVANSMRNPVGFALFYQACGDASGAPVIAMAMDRVLRNGTPGYIPPAKFTMAGIADAWLQLIAEVR